MDDHDRTARLATTASHGGKPPNAARSPVPWGWPTAVMLSLVAALVSTPAHLATRSVADPATAETWGVLFQGIVLLAVTLWWLRRRHRRGWRLVWGARRPCGRDAALGLGVAVAVGLADAALLAAVVALGHDPLAAQPWVEPQLQAAPIPFTVGVVIVAPLAEETIFRGVLFQGLQRSMGARTAAIVSAAVFAGVHVDTISVAAAALLLAAFVSGLVFAWLFHRRDTIVAPVVAHATVNAAALAGAALRLPSG
ncbi:MAG: lysostaphin resistance A-like protein [Egibacteraceae bacterium]